MNETMHRKKLAGTGQCPRYLIIIKNLGFLYSHFWDLALSVRSAGWEVHVIAAENAELDSLQQLGIIFHPVKRGIGPWDLRSDIHRSIQTYSMIHMLQPDCVHIIYLKNVLLDGFSTRLHGTPVIGAVTGLGALFAEQKLLYRAIRPAVVFCLRLSLRHRNSVLAIENSDDKRFLLKHGVVPGDQTQIIPGAGIKRDRIQPNFIKSGKPIILFSARMIRPKGVAELLAAARILQERGLNFELWLAGGVDARHPKSIAERELREAEATGIAKWLGHRSDIPELLSQSSIVCLPTYYREGLPRSLVEAAAAGLPIVTTDVPGCREVVVDGLNGFTVPPRDAESLASALSKLIDSRDLRESMGRASRRRFEEKFSLDAVFAAFNECYRTLGLDLRLPTSLQPQDGS